MQHLVSPSRTTLAAAAAIAASNLAVLGIGLLLGADMQVARSTAPAVTEIGVGLVLLMSLVPALLGGLLLWLAARRSMRAWHAVGWLGLALGLLTLPMPFSVAGSAGTTVTLATMHVVAGVVWFTVTRRTAAAASHRLIMSQRPDLRTTG